MSLEEIKDNLSSILNGMPNCYTFAKSLAERSIL